MRHGAFLGPFAALAALALPVSPLLAEKPWGWAINVVDRRDLATLHPIIQHLLTTDAVGAREPWRSPSGKAGFVYLKAGGDRAGSSKAVVRITRIESGREARLYVFRYRKDPARGWAVAG